MTTSSFAPVLLVESEEAVIKDVSCSLKLIDIPVNSVRSIEEAISSLDQREPTMIIVRSKLNQDDKAALSLADKLSKHEGLEAPLYVLCTSSEEQSLVDSSDKFAGIIRLPVEFPAFPERIKEILEMDSSDRKNIAASTVLPREAKIDRRGIPDSAPDQPVDPAIKDRNLSLAQTLQSAVLQELELDGRINHAKEEHVPGIVNQITAKVCVRFATGKS